VIDHLGAENEVQGNHNKPRNRGEASAHRHTTAADPGSGGSENWRASLTVMDASCLGNGQKAGDIERVM